MTEDCLSNLIFSDIQGSSLVAGFAFVEVLGCTNENACNYNENANTDDGSCDYPETGFDCDGNCIAEIDCFGICGGGAVEDCFGECGGPAVEMNVGYVMVVVQNQILIVMEIVL